MKSNFQTATEEMEKVTIQRNECQTMQHAKFDISDEKMVREFYNESIDALHIVISKKVKGCHRIIDSYKCDTRKEAYCMFNCLCDDKVDYRKLDDYVNVCFGLDPSGVDFKNLTESQKLQMTWIDFNFKPISEVEQFPCHLLMTLVIDFINTYAPFQLVRCFNSRITVWTTDDKFLKKIVYGKQGFLDYLEEDSSDSGYFTQLLKTDLEAISSITAGTWEERYPTKTPCPYCLTGTCTAPKNTRYNHLPRTEGGKNLKECRFCKDRYCQNIHNPTYKHWIDLEWIAGDDEL